jgi:hypothetical protein
MLHFSTRILIGACSRFGAPARIWRAASHALAVLGLCSLALAAQAQDLPAADPLRHPVLVNLKGGFNLSTYTGGGYIGWETGLKGGFSGGFSATRAISANVAWQAELLYSRKGAVAYDYYHVYAAPAPPSGPTANTYRSELHYLDLPVLLTVGPGSGSRKGWYVAAGPQLSLALDKHESVVPDGVGNSDSYEENLNGDAKSLRRLGAGYVVGIGRQWTGYGIELRYSGDITNVYRDGYGSGALYPGSGNRFHNGVIQLQVNLALRGGKWRWDWGKGGGYPYPHDGPVGTPEPRQRPRAQPQPQPRPET